MTGRYGDIDYPKVTKRSVLLGLTLFLIGAIGELLIHTMGLQVPAWEETLLFDLEIIGTLIVLCSSFVFGIILPLTE